MAINPADAAAAYRAFATDRPKGMEPAAGPQFGTRAQEPKSSFANLVRDAALDMVETNRRAEQLSVDATAGKASVQEVVTAIAEAEATLETVVTVRNRIISAYQEIMRMPI